MAIEQEQDKNAPQQPQSPDNQPGEPLQLGTGSNAPSAGGGAPASSAKPSAPQGSGRFNNLQNYIKANKGFNSGEQIAGQATQRLEGIRQGIESQKSQYQNQAQNLQQNLGTQGQQLQQQAFQDPNAVLQNQGQAAEFQKLRTGGYGQDIQNLGQNVNQYQSGVQNLQDMAQQAGTEAGRFGLLQQRYNNPNYSRGQQRLDQLLLQSTPGSAKSLSGNLQNIAQQGQGLQSGLQSGVAAQQSSLGDLAKQRQDQISNLLQYGSNGGAGGENELGQMGYGDIEQNLQSKLASMQQNIPQQYSQLKQNLTSNNPLDAQYSNLVPLKAGQNIYNLNLASYLSPEDVVKGRVETAKAQQLATPEDYARYQGLQQLAGGDNSYFSGIDQANLGKFSPMGFDTQKFQTDLASAKSNQQDQLTARDKLLTGLKGSLGAPDAREVHENTNLRDAINEYQKNPSTQAFNTIKNNMDKVYANSRGNQYWAGNNYMDAIKKSMPRYNDLQTDRLFGSGVGSGTVPPIVKPTGKDVSSNV